MWYVNTDSLSASESNCFYEEILINDSKDKHRESISGIDVIKNIRSKKKNPLYIQLIYLELVLKLINTNQGLTESESYLQDSTMKLKHLILILNVYYRM